MSFCPCCDTVNGLHELGCQLGDVRPCWFDLIDDGSLDTVFRCGELEFRFPDTSEFRDSETGELGLNAFFREHLESMVDDLFDEIEDTIEKMVEGEEEYETTHQDAGDAYAHCVEESRYQWQEKLLSYIGEHFDDLPEDWQERVNDIDFEMRPDHIFMCIPADGIDVDSFGVGEVECQLEVDQIGKFPAEAVSAYLKHKEIRESHGCFYQYACTDAVWVAVVTDEAIEAAMED